MGEGERDYEVVLTDRAKRDYLTIVAKPDSISVNNILDALDTLPYIGRVYDPLYDAARTPFELRVAYAGSYGIYYVFEEALRQVHVYFIEDQRQDPLKRFGDRDEQ